MTHGSLRCPTNHAANPPHNLRGFKSDDGNFSAVFQTTWGPVNNSAKAHSNINHYKGNTFIAGGVRPENKTLVLVGTDDVDTINNLANFGSDAAGLGKTVRYLRHTIHTDP